MEKKVAQGGFKRMEKEVAHSGCGSCFTHKGRRSAYHTSSILKFIKDNFVFFLYVIGCQLK